MEVRRVQVTRGGTFFITLPKAWAEKNGLKRSSIVATLVTADGRLLIDPKYDVERTLTSIAIKPTPYLEREIIGKYLLGYDIIQVEAKNRISLEDRERIKRTLSRLIGLEIIEEDYAKIVIQCLLEPSALSPEKILRREQSISLSMHRDAVTALIEGDVHLAKNVIARDDEVDRLYFLLVRILRTIIQNPGLSEKLRVFPIDCLDYRLSASLVESIGDQSAQIADHTIQLGGLKFSDVILEKLLKIHRIVHESHKDAVIAFLSHNIEIADSVRSKRDTVEELCREIESIADKQQIETSAQILSVSSLMSQIYDYSLDISDLTMPRVH